MAANQRRQADDAARAVVAAQSQPQQVALMTLADANKALAEDLGRRDDELARKLSGSFPADYFTGLVLTQVRKLAPDVQMALAKTPQGRASLVAACYQAAELHLPFLMGRMWLVPFRNNNVQEVQALVGYQGLVDLITAPGTGVTYVDSAVVRARDHFDYMRGTDGYLRHREYMPVLTDATKQEDLVYDRGPVTFAWARVVYANGQDRWDLMTYSELEVIRLQSKAGRTGPWATHPDEMRKKTVLRRLAKTQRISLDAMRVIEREDDWEADRARAAQPVQDDQQTALRRKLLVQVVGKGGQGGQQAADDQWAGMDTTDAPAGVSVAETGPSDAAAPDHNHAPTDDGTLVDGCAACDVLEEHLRANAQTVPPVAAKGGPTPQTAACGATVTDGSDDWTCTLAPRHRGGHTDGQHDWPA